MTHSNSFVAVLKSNGKILRENNSKVAIPFGSEYSILLKNLKSVRALAEITIDGISATDKQKIIIPANSEFDIKRYIKNGNLENGNKFKFIERTDSIEQHRGIKADDGIIRIEFWSELVYNNNQWGSLMGGYQTFYNVDHTPTTVTTSSSENNYIYSKCIGSDNSQTLNPSGLNQVNCCMASTTQTTSSQVKLNDAGITVPGSYSDQKFSVGSWFPTEFASTVITFQLVGKFNDDPVLKPITVEVKPRCLTCGRLNKATNKFCSECGTSLKIY